jgi:large subunit ribosomal protein L4
MIQQSLGLQDLDRKVSVYNLGGEIVDHLELSEFVFAAPVRKDILARVVLWQLAKRRAGTHKTKGISEISGTTRKPHKQKGTGRARQGSLRSPQMRGGAVIFGPVVRSHAYGLPKKVRRLGLRTALSSRFIEGKLRVIEDLTFSAGKTKEILKVLGGDLFSSQQDLVLSDKASTSSGKKDSSILMVTGKDPCPFLKRATANLHHVDILPQHGLNVYDILRHDKLILSREAVQYLEGWLV